MDSDRVYVEVDGELAGTASRHRRDGCPTGVKLLLPTRYADELASPVTADAVASAAV